MPQLRIRVADSGDRDLVIGLLASAARWLRSRGIDYWQNWLAPPAHHLAWVDEGLSRGEFRILEIGDEIVGCLRLQYDDELFWGSRLERAGYIHSLTVDRRLAGRGFGRAALDLVGRSLLDKGVGLIRLDCGIGVTGLRAYYESLGFEAVGTTTVDGEELVLYERDLSGVFDR